MPLINEDSDKRLKEIAHRLHNLRIEMEEKRLQERRARDQITTLQTEEAELLRKAGNYLGSMRPTIMVSLDKYAGIFEWDDRVKSTSFESHEIIR